MNNIQKALMTTFEYHRGQTRKLGGAPYVVHILDVARILLSEPGVSEDVVVAGILHDTLEDTPICRSNLSKTSGPMRFASFNSPPSPGKARP